MRVINKHEIIQNHTEAGSFNQVKMLENVGDAAEAWYENRPEP